MSQFENMLNYISEINYPKCNKREDFYPWLEYKLRNYPISSCYQDIIKLEIVQGDQKKNMPIGYFWEK